MRSETTLMCGDWWTSSLKACPQNNKRVQWQQPVSCLPAPNIICLSLIVYLCLAIPVRYLIQTPTRRRCPSATRLRERGMGRKCEHGRQRSRCKECGGGSLCEHGRMRSRCKECGDDGPVTVLEATEVEECDWEEDPQEWLPLPGSAVEAR